MDARNVIDSESAATFVREAGIENIKLAVTDLDGIMRGKYVSRKKFLSALEKGFGFCDGIFGWDSADELYAEDSFTGWERAFPDAWAQIDPSSCRPLPLEDNQSALFLADFEHHEAAAVCPRALLKRVLAHGKSLGFTASAAAEFEFFLFDETPDSLEDRGYRNPQPMTPGNFGYSVLRNSTHADFYHQLMGMTAGMGMTLEGLHTETGPGVLEAALEHSSALRAADNATLFKTFTKVLAQQQGLMATFMARWSTDYPGQSGHLHLSLQDNDGNAVFFDESQAHNMSDAMRWFIGGQQKLLPELLCMVAGTCNSYSRLVPGFWAPTAATWGIDNRTCALRAIPGKPAAQRVEYRIAAADINPYLALAAAFGSGFWGIEHKVEPGEPFSGDAYSGRFPRAMQLPATLTEAAARLRKSKAARELFGGEFVDHYAYTREWEDAEQRKAVTDWQLKRYFEII
ncbi:MAG: glutamine synthetase family protein [Halieaceae bacterium]|nr:glutamine synthetase family protein [Halieaceae bacterium]